MPPASWLPADDWLPEPSWPQPPDGWSWWTVTARPAPSAGSRALSQRGRPSFPLATRAAQSTVSLAALFPERARETASYGVARERYAAGSPPAPGVRTKAGREYYRPASERHESSLDNSTTHHLTRAALDPSEVAHAAQDVTAAADAAAAAPPGIRLSPLLRLVGEGVGNHVGNHGSNHGGVRARFTVGGPAAQALSQVLAPSLEAAVGRTAASGTTADEARPAKRGFRLGRRADRSAPRGTAAASDASDTRGAAPRGGTGPPLSTSQH